MKGPFRFVQDLLGGSPDDDSASLVQFASREMDQLQKEGVREFVLYNFEGIHSEQRLIRVETCNSHTLLPFVVRVRTFKK